MSLPRIAVTTGDPAGIGPEVCLKLLANPEVLEICQPIIFGDASVLNKAAEECGLPRPEKVVHRLEEATEACLLDFKKIAANDLSLIHISEPTDRTRSRMPSSA